MKQNTKLALVLAVALVALLAMHAVHARKVIPIRSSKNDMTDEETVAYMDLIRWAQTQKEGVSFQNREYIQALMKGSSVRKGPLPVPLKSFSGV